MTRKLAQSFVRAWAREQELPFAPVRRDPDWLSLWQVREHLVDRAITAAEERGRSYRRFHVGGAAFVSSTQPELLRSLGRTVQHIFTGANWKLGQEQRNTCAEQEIVAQLRQQQHLFPVKEVLALVVAGEPLGEPDRESGIVTDTLHPCNHCRHLLMHTASVSRNTLIIMVNLSNSNRKIMRFEELLKMHGQTFPSRRRSSQ